MQNQWENGVHLALPSLLIFWQESHIVGFPIAGRWSSIILLIIQTFRFHIAKGKIQIEFLRKISSVIKEQVLQQAAKISFMFLETSECYWKLWGNLPQHPIRGVIKTVASPACFLLEHLLAR